MKHFCISCNREVSTEVKKKTEIYKVGGGAVTVISDVRQCKLCGTEIWDYDLDDANLKRVYDTYKLTNPNFVSPYDKRYN